MVLLLEFVKRKDDFAHLSCAYMSLFKQLKNSTSRELSVKIDRHKIQRALLFLSAVSKAFF